MGNKKCNSRREGKFTSTGPVKGHYPVDICDQPPNHPGQVHQDSTTGAIWRGQ